MEHVEVSLTPLQRRAGAARVRWTDLAAQQRRRGEPVRVLAPGEDVVLHVDGHTFHRGRVLSYLGAGADGSYVITIGAPMARRAATRRTAATVEGEVQEVELRVVPAQRRPAPVELYL